MYIWSRRVKRGEPYYEVSSKGDTRYSAIFAKIDNKSIEEIYQLDIKGYRGEVSHWKEAKGKPPKNKTVEEAYKEYKKLWEKYFDTYPELLDEIAEKAKDKTITDMFGITPVNQARAICEILNERKPMKSKFLNKDHDYKNMLDPVEQYLKVAATYLSKKKGISKEEAEKKVREYIKTNKKFNNPRVKFRKRDLKGNVSTEISNLNSYIKYVTNSGNIMVPSFTVYFKPEIKKSLHSEFIFENVAERNHHKSLAKKYELEGNELLFKKHNTIQKTKKIFNNSLSGAYGSNGTILYNPSAHYTLTSITRCVSGTGNSLSETVISGNKHFAKPEIVINYISTVITFMDKVNLRKIIDKYNLHIPTVEEVMKMILKSTRIYWKSVSAEHKIQKLVETLSDEEKVWVTYLNDIYHMRVYNESLLRKIFDGILINKNIDTTNVSKDEMVKTLTDNSEYLNMLHHVRADVLMGKVPAYSKLSEEDVRELYISLLTMKETFESYDDLFSTFLLTDLLPTNIAYVRDMVREVIVLSDTDSTCATYEDWVKWYYGENKFGPEGMAATGVIMTIATTNIDHGIKVFASNMNIPKDRVNLIAMKNEFYWDVFVNTNVSKHYFADYWIKEGGVRKSPKNEIKGVALIASTAYQKARDLRTWLMNDVFKRVRNKEHIPLDEYLLKVMAMEKYIVEKVYQGSPDVLKLDKIKSKDSYKLDEYKSPYFHYILWQEAFAKEYGNAPDPMYMAVKTPLILDSKRKINEFLDTLENEHVKSGLMKVINDGGKQRLGSLKLPLANTIEKGLPKELINILDVDTVVFDNCNSLYMALESIGYYKLPKTKLLDIELNLRDKLDTLNINELIDV